MRCICIPWLGDVWLKMEGGDTFCWNMLAVFIEPVPSCIVGIYEDTVLGVGAAPLLCGRIDNILWSFACQLIYHWKED